MVKHQFKVGDQVRFKTGLGYCFREGCVKTVRSDAGWLFLTCDASDENQPHALTQLIDRPELADGPW